MSSNRDEAILSGGIEIGDRVITSPIRGVADGMKIAVVKPGSTYAAPANAAGEE